MSWDGFLPKGVTCKACGKVLQGQGEGRPAESYAGTYTGLCYGCEGGAAFATGERRDSGAAYWSHPPHCPSWRRDRETFYGFEGCAKCKGQGRAWVSRRDSEGGSYTVECPDCGKRDAEYEAQFVTLHGHGKVRPFVWDGACANGPKCANCKAPAAYCHEARSERRELCGRCFEVLYPTAWRKTHANPRTMGRDWREHVLPV